MTPENYCNAKEVGRKYRLQPGLGTPLAPQLKKLSRRRHNLLTLGVGTVFEENGGPVVGDQGPR